MIYHISTSIINPSKNMGEKKQLRYLWAAFPSRHRWSHHVLRRHGESRASQSVFAGVLVRLCNSWLIRWMPAKSSDWWFGTCVIFLYIGNVIIPTDELIFFRGVETTNRSCITKLGWLKHVETRRKSWDVYCKHLSTGDSDFASPSTVSTIATSGVM